MAAATMRRFALVLAGAAAIGIGGCKPRTPMPILTAPDGKVIEAPPAPGEQEEKAASALLGEARALAKSGDTKGAGAKEDQILAGFPATAAAAEIFAARGAEAERTGDTTAAVAAYEKLLFYRPSVAGGDAIRERYGALLIGVERYADAANMLLALYQSRHEARDKARVGFVLVDALAQAGRARKAVEVCADLVGLSGLAAPERDRAAALALDLLQTQLTFQETASLWSDVRRSPSWRFLQPAIAFRLGKIYYHTRDFDRSEEMIALVADRYGDSPYAGQAREFLARLKSRFLVDPNAIGVLLPLSGKYQQFGQRSLEAIKLGLGPVSTLRLVVKDTQGDAVIASQAVEDLVLTDHVAAIIGPLFSNEALAAALKAEEFSVPLLSLSYMEGLPEIGPFIFRTALTVKAQAQALAKVAFDSLGYRTFALLYPRSRYGEEFVDAFWDEVDRRRGSVRGAESYEHDQTTFQEPVRKLVGRWYTLARKDYREALDELRRQKLPPHRLQMEVAKLDKVIPPIVDFDAIIIPDGSRNIGLIAPALVFEDIILTHNPKMLEKIKKATGHDDVEPLTLLGASTWNSPQTLESCEKYCEDAIFVDGFNADSPQPAVRDFVTAFRTATGADPHLTDAQAFDTAGLLRAVLLRQGARARPALAEALRRMPPFEGVTGRLAFDKLGEIDRQLVVLTIHEGIIRPWQSEGERPQG